MAMARRVSLFEREVSVRMAPVAVEVLHGVARVLSEGELLGSRYQGSTMLTIDLAKTVGRISDPPTATTAQQVAFLYASDDRCREQAKRLAAREARRTAGVELASASVDVESRARGSELHLEFNVEAVRRTS